MRHYNSLFVILAALLPLSLLAADSSSPGKKEAARDTAAPSSGLKFRPTHPGAPSVRVSGGSRGSGDATITLDVLAPDDIGITTQEQPSLFWYQSKPAAAKFELTLLEDNKPKPILQVGVDRSTRAGIQRLKLSDRGVKLTPGIDYQWVIALITDADNRSSDLVASGVIRRVEPSPTLKEKLSKANASALPAVYAEEGIWYDALAALSDQVDAQPENKALRDARADLLRQVGLKAAAAAESGSSRKP